MSSTTLLSASTVRGGLRDGGGLKEIESGHEFFFLVFLSTNPEGRSWVVELLGSPKTSSLITPHRHIVTNGH